MISYSLEDIRKNCYPSISYEVKGTDESLDMGDTVKIDDEEFPDGLVLSARVSEQHISFTKNGTNQTVFDNYKALKNKLSKDLIDRYEELAEQAKPYELRLLTDKGTQFKNSTGLSVLTAELWKSNRKYDATFNFRNIDTLLASGLTYTVDGSTIPIDKPFLVSVDAFIGNDLVATRQITFTNVSDGAKGQDGAQGIQGPAGADGKTPYWHTAYANSTDGKTDFSLTDSTNKRFIGQYTDYTQADSTDPTKYKWVDMTANVKTGSRNLLINTKSMDNIAYTSANKTSETYMGGSVVSALAPSGSYKDAFRQKMSIVPDELEYIVSFYAKSTAVSHNVTCYFYSPNTTIKSVSSQGVVNDRPAGADGSTNVNVTNEWKRYWIKWTLRAPKDDTEKIPKEVIIGRNWDSVNSVSIALPALYAGNLNTDHSEAPEDTQLKIDSKADQALTQEQLNALSEQASIAKAELQAKASIDTLNQWITSYQNYVTSNNADSQQAKADLIAWSQKVEALGTQMGEVKETKIFMDTYFSQSSEGLVIGQTDGTSNILIKEDRISMFSAGNEVMYISQGVLNINNGIFALSIQLGRFREEQYVGNKDINVIRYVGGV